MEDVLLNLKTVSSRDVAPPQAQQSLPADQCAITSPSISTSIATFIPSVKNLGPMLTHGKSIPASEISPKNLIILKLGDDELAVDQTTVPDPPAIVFSHNLPALFSQWHCSNTLVVNGRGIPIKYWPVVYQAKFGVKGGAWKALRTQWGNWKVCLILNVSICRLVR